MSDVLVDFSEEIRIYKDRIRIFLILYFLSEDMSEEHGNNTLKKVFKSEVKIQKVDFLVRNPDYFAYQILLFAQENKISKQECKEIVKNIFTQREPSIRRLEMEKFFFGAYENIDDVISFLKSIGFIDFNSKKSLDLRTIEKHYYITELACRKIDEIQNLKSLYWYKERIELIKRFFGDLGGTQLKDLQYEIDEYKDASYKECISNIQDRVKKIYLEMFGEELYEI
ncbi:MULTISPECIES: hypothetical protein [Bacillus]|uniref:hypothetical protein n=1 Tax=Bacillus TaxID=1386 RepID=UPI001C5AD628|nr:MULTISPECIES: hypothetical protein [Bacillus]MBW3496192.1 hypothetical protein [Bacillus sp. FDAARGOS_1420]MDI6504848.1 hypothetical protein [Bacillus wiedmannii]MDI6510749.1 hypothetical protein [Bacillus wiedmannii]